MNTLKISIATIQDVLRLQEIGKQTFIETFSDVNTEENMTQYIANSFSIEKLTKELNDAQTAFYFAQIDEKIIGYLKLNFGKAQTESMHENALEIERIYVLKDYLGKNVGQALYEKALQIASEKNAVYIWLGVWEENTRAIKFYQKNGFEVFDKHIFKLGDDEQTDIMMRKFF
jgi:ribosomal protein S18 acetylase RimI-like enzyme